MNVKMWGLVCAAVVAVTAGGGGHAQNRPIMKPAQTRPATAATKPATAKPAQATPATTVTKPAATESMKEFADRMVLELALAAAVELHKTPGNEIDNRELLNLVYFDPDATADQKARARKMMTELNAATIFGKKVFDGDELAYAYTVKKGDTLSGLAKRSGCPVAIIRQINGMKPADVLQADRKIKLLRGPFHAQVNKADCTIDVFALTTSTDGEQTKTLVYHARVAVGKNNGTPVGLFRIAAKAEKATWYPPASMKATHPNPIKWGEKDYPLGKEGIFMRLTGAEPATEKLTGYGIHSTSDQASIGRAQSHGCVRIGDKDIRQIFNLLADGSEVRIVP